MSRMFFVLFQIRWFASTWTVWSTAFYFERRTTKQFYEVKCWYQCRSCRESSVAVACPYCYQSFEVNGRALGALHARECPFMYPLQLRHVGRESVHKRWRYRYNIHLMTTTTWELSDKDVFIY